MKITGLYERLSKDDSQKDESVSIKHQKEILETYAKRHGFGNVQHFVDDGISGTVFQRPGLDSLLTEVRAGNVSTVIIKDASRLGRDVYEIGNLKKAFEDNDVRLISADGNLDTANGFDIMSIFRDVFNEWFVADTSKKIRAVSKAKAQNGKHHTTQAPYGYMPSPEDKLVWAVDEPAAEVVREIFRMFVGGMGAHQIARSLRDRDVKLPCIHKAERDDKPPRYQLKYADNYWRGGVITAILDNMEYTGAAVMQKVTTKSYKDKKKYIRPADDWVIMENAHEAIISEDTYQSAQKLRQGRRKPSKVGDLGILNGLLVCSECGGKLHMKRQVKKGKDGIRLEYCYYDCSMSPGFKVEFATCSCHSVKREPLEAGVLEHIQRTLEHAKNHEQDFMEKLSASHGTEQKRILRKSQMELSKVQKRIAELDDIIARTFEHGVTKKLTKERFDFLLDKYEKEQYELKHTAAELEKVLTESSNQTANAEKFMSVIQEITMPTELTRELAYKLIECVIVGKAEHIEGSRRNKRQDIRIRYNYIGDLDNTVMKTSK